MVIGNPEQNPEQFVSKDFICMQLHAMAELINLFFSKDITISDCCRELNIKDFTELIALTNIIIIINNFSEQKDEYHNLTKNEEYIKDSLDAFNFKYINVIEGNLSPKQIIKEVRDAFEHKSFYIHKYGKIYVDNKRTGFKAIIDLSFLTGAFCYYFNANNINTYLLDDRNIDYDDSKENLIENLKIYRVISKRKNEERNIDGIARQDLRTLTKKLTFNENYNYVEIKLTEEEKKALLNFFKAREINKDNLSVGLSLINHAGPAFSSILNEFIWMNFNCRTLNNNDTSKVVDKFIKGLDSDSSFDIRQKKLIKVFFDDKKYCKNYFKLIFIKYVIGNLDYEMTEEDKHIRNCLSHSKYSWLNSEEILLKDHPNGINNESNITFIKKYKIEDLYNKAKELWIYTPIQTTKRL